MDLRDVLNCIEKNEWEPGMLVQTLIPTLGKRRQEDLYVGPGLYSEFHCTANQGYIVRLCEKRERERKKEERKGRERERGGELD